MLASKRQPISSLKAPSEKEDCLHLKESKMIGSEAEYVGPRGLKRVSMNTGQSTVYVYM
jgi:hypothetical protein